MGAVNREQWLEWMRGPSVWKGPVLALLLERPGHVYELSTRMWQRLGPAWHSNAKDLYRLLEEAESLGLAASSRQMISRTSQAPVRVYAATGSTAAAVDYWMERPLPRESFRSVLTARMVLSREEHVPALLHALAEQEEFLFEQSRVYSVPIAVHSYTALEMELARQAVVTRVEAGLEWVERARAMLIEFRANGRV